MDKIKVGDTFYFKDCCGVMQERTCKHIKHKEGVETMYFSSYDEHGGLFINESDIIDKDSEEIQKYLKDKEKKAWKDFWTEKRTDEMLSFLQEHLTVGNSEKFEKTFNEFINSKSN